MSARFLASTAMTLRGARFAIARTLCRACGVFAASIEDRHEKGIGVSNWCPICRANIEYAGALE